MALKLRIRSVDGPHELRWGKARRWCCRAGIRITDEDKLVNSWWRWWWGCDSEADEHPVVPITFFILGEFSKVSKRTNRTRVLSENHVPALSSFREPKGRAGIG